MLDTFARQESAVERKRLHCAQCKRVTIHNLEARCVGGWDDPDAMVSGGSKFSIFRCGACDEICYETASWHSEDMDFDSDGTSYCPETTYQYPAPVSAHFNFNLEYTPPRLDEILDEMLYAMAGSKLTLATIGLRLAIEFIVKDKKCVGSNLKLKIDDLHAKSLIDEDQKKLLHRIRLRGNAGAHEAIGMQTRELIAAMSIIEGLLENLYNGPARHEATMKRAKQMLGADD